jgi:hypothetical protein
MKYSVILIFITLCASCNNQHKNKPEADTAIVKTDSPEKPIAPDTAPAINNDSALLQLSKNILGQLRAGQYDQLTQFIHPVFGLRFSPYGHIDTLRDIIFFDKTFNNLVKQSKKITWGDYDGSGEPILLNWAGYVKRFVYDKDFLSAPQNAVNSFISEGNSLNNLQKVYPGYDFTEFYFPGVDPKYGGMDWKTLRLVFKKENDRYYLVGVVHDEWTI